MAASGRRPESRTDWACADHGTRLPAPVVLVDFVVVDLTY